MHSTLRYRIPSVLSPCTWKKSTAKPDRRAKADSRWVVKCTMSLKANRVRGPALAA